MGIREYTHFVGGRYGNGGSTAFSYEMGECGFEEFTQLKTLLVHSGPRAPVFS